MLRTACWLVASLSILPFLSISAQTGPGGVGNNVDNGLWLRADALALTDGSSVATWPDLSGNGNDANQTVVARRPIFVAAGPLNNMPSVRLDGGADPDGDRLIVSDADILDGSNGLTYFAVLRADGLNGAPRGILGKRVNQNTDNQNASYAYTWYIHVNNNVFVDINTQNNRQGTSTGLSNNTNYLLSFDFDGSRPTDSRTRIINGSEVVRQFTESSASVSNSPEPVVIGGLNDNYPQYLGADYGEVIHYNRSLSPLERQLVNNYLSGKYAIPLVSGDLYAHDAPTNGDYDFDIAGIGRISASDQLTAARGSGTLTVANPTNLDNNEFLLWGHNGQPQTFSNSGGLPAGSLSSLGRVWRTAEVNSTGSGVDVGAVDMTFDLGGLGLSEDEVQLLIDTNNDGSFADETAIEGARLIGAGVFQFDAVTALANNRSFTIARASSSLPVELLTVRATRQTNGSVSIDWTTAQETDNDYFEIERIAVNDNWASVGRVDGGGTTRSRSDYRFIDVGVPAGILYYRLRQVDFDGATSLYPVLALNAVPVDRRAPFPNPTAGKITLSGGTADQPAICVFNARGHLLAELPPMAREVDLTTYPPGLYFLRQGNWSAKVVKR